MNPILAAPTPSQKNRHVTQPFIVVGCVIEKDGAYLLVNENEKWNIPAGWLELGETPEIGAKREAEEETGREVKIESFLGIYTLIKHRPEKVLHAVKILFIAHLTGETISSKENLKMQWFTLEALQSIHGKFWDPDLPNVIADAANRISYPVAIQQHKTVVPPTNM